jgi:3-phenylpropionate/trans-cinnamate dioxygenase ferredoxin subunit
MPQMRIPAAEIPEGQVRRYEVDGSKLAVVNLGEKGFRAVDAVCSHAQYFLDEGEVDVEDGTIECWKHGSTFDLDTGRPRTLPATQPIATYAVTQDGDDILIEVNPT